MLTLQVDHLWTTVSPLPWKSPIRETLTALLSYQPAESSNLVRLLEPVSPDVWRFPSGLAPRVIAALEGGNVPHVVQRARVSIRAADVAPRLFPIRPYQASAVIALTKGLSIGGVLQAATGAGKTAMAAKIIQLLKTDTLFCVHTKDLMKQAQDAFSNFLGIEVGQIGSGKSNIKTVNVATIQTLAKGKHDDYLKTVQLAIFDECHHVAAPTIYSVRHKMINAPVAIGLSASPWRDDGHDMLIEAACGPVKYVITASDLIDQGFLVPPSIHVYRRQLPHALKFGFLGGGKFHEAYRNIVAEDPRRHDFTTHLVHEQLKLGRRVLVLVKYIEHGVQLALRIPDSVFIEGSNSASSRAEAFDAFRDGRLRCLIGTSLCDEGVDIPAADALILAGAGASSTRALQRIGRVLRPAEGKTSAYVADIVDEHPTFRRQFYSRHRIYKTERLFQVQEIQVPLDTVIPTY